MNLYTVPRYLRERDSGPVLVIVSPDEIEGLGWQDRALCAETDPEAFFPEKGGSTREAKRVCQSCEVRAECLEYVLEHGDESWTRHGIWGGISERERRRLKRQAA
jgi:WhiB family transcriptional regulator, redox-sensing transcriptional regulator